MKSKNNIITSIDIGTSKIICLIGLIDNTDNLRVIGYGHNESKGFRCGAVTDIKLAETSLRSAIEVAERMSGINIESAIINISGSKIDFNIAESSIQLNSHPITDNDVERLIKQTLEQFNSQNSEIINYFPLEYSIDNETGIKDPRLMFGSILSCKIYFAIASSNILLNIANSLARCHIDTNDFILSAYASAIACLNKDELEQGSTIIDIGGGSTDIAVFSRGSIINSETIMIGGKHITSDISYGLSLSMEEAERIKIIYGSAFNTAFNSYEIIDLPIKDNIDGETSYVRVNELNDIIRPRIEEILELVKNYLVNSKISKILTKRIVITGGVSQLSGMKELASHILGNNVRIGMPKHIQNLEEKNNTPDFSVAIGMLIHVHNRFLQKKYRIKDQESKKFNFIKKIFNWF